MLVTVYKIFISVTAAINGKFVGLNSNLLENFREPHPSLSFLNELNGNEIKPNFVRDKIAFGY